MSGELVGEVLAARTGCLADLPRTHTLALIAIASRCRTDSRQGWVVKSEITTAVGCSTRTAERIIAALTKRGLIEIVKRGYKLPGQQPRAPVYELSTLPPSKVAEAPFPPSKVAEAQAPLPPSKVAEAQAPLPPSRVAEAQGTRSRQIGTTLPPNPATLPPNQHHAPATLDGDLNVLTDVTNQTSFGDKRARGREASVPTNSARATAHALLQECTRGLTFYDDRESAVTLIDAVADALPHLSHEEIRREFDQWSQGNDQLLLREFASRLRQVVRSRHNGHVIEEQP